MRRALLLIFPFVFGLLQQLHSQSCPPNIDFESGDFSNWECYTGTTAVENGKNVMKLALSGPMPGRHEIITANGTNDMDPYGNFPKLCPYGGTYSVKLGNESTGGQAEGLSYTFTVPTTVDTFTFTYFYAVVFEDPDHLLPQQPRFFVTAYDVATGNIVNCASFDYVSDGGIPGFEVARNRSSVLFKKWSPASLQFAGLAGRAVRLEFKTADCTLGGHFGYAYVDVGSACSNILATAPYCIETNSLILNAPYGFKSYTWYNANFASIVGTQQTLTLSPPPATTGVFHVDVVPYPGYGCRDTLQAVVNPLPVPDTPGGKWEYTYCQNQFVSPLSAVAQPGNVLMWYSSSSGGTGSTNAPIPSTTKAGVQTFYVSQKALFGCESFRKKITVTIVPTPVASFSINATRQCQNGNLFTFTSTSTNKSSSVYTWSFGNSQSQSSPDDSVVNHTYAAAGAFNVKLKVDNAGTCSSEKTLPITVVPKPVANFTYPPVICEKQTAVVVADRSSVPGGIATINKWWWSFNGTTYQTQNPSSFIPNDPGTLPVKLVVTTTEGCASDTNTTEIRVRYRPTTSFSYTTPLCDNEIISFTDLSVMPQGASSEFVVKWYWNFGSRSSTLQHPSLNLTPGVQHAKLVTESNFGCKSIEADSIMNVNAKPQISLDINDSCVFRTINYRATDLLNTVNKWYWDFGTGLYRDGGLVSKTYSKEGYRPLTLMAQTIEGCRDTIIRPFTIYDNKAFAGKDTIAAKGEPVQLNAKGGANVRYSWTPVTGLDDATREAPLATLDKDQLYRLDAITDKGCDSHSKILIKRFAGPELYIPTAFTPNGDGRNDILKVFPVGIRAFKSFAVYNRYGQQVYYTTNYNEGWDGRVGGVNVDGTYVAYATAIDYRGKEMINKVSVVLIR